MRFDQDGPGLLIAGVEEELREFACQVWQAADHGSVLAHVFTEAGAVGIRVEREEAG